MTQSDGESLVQRGVAQFFFEVGYGACFAEAMIRNGMKPPFELSDAHIEAAWLRSIEAHEDGAEMDRYLDLASAADTRPTPPQSESLVERVGTRRVVHELRLSEQVFRDYGRQHADKASSFGTGNLEANERMRKAKRNFERADACKAALDMYDASPPVREDVVQRLVEALEDAISFIEHISENTGYPSDDLAREEFDDKLSRYRASVRGEG